jgi:hypothetical protein
MSGRLLTRDEDRARRADRIWGLHPSGARIWGCKRKLKRARRLAELVARSAYRDNCHLSRRAAGFVQMAVGL